MDAYTMNRKSLSRQLGSYQIDMPRIILIILLAIIPFFSFLGCGGKDRDLPSPQLQTTVAVWNGGKLSLGEWMHSFRELQNPTSLDAQQLGEAVMQLCHEWVAEKILAERANESGLQRDPKMVEKLANYREEQLVVLFLRQTVDEKIVVKRDALKTFYEENQDRFRSPATYTYYRIFFSNLRHEKEEAKRRAEECWTLIEKGANFHDLLAEYSDTREDKKNLEYGPFKAGEMPVEIEKVILDTPLHRHSPVIELPDGYMIIYPQTKTDPVVRPFTSVEMQIYNELFTQQQTTNVEELLRSLQEKYEVTTHTELFDAAEVKPDSIILEINPGSASHTWDEFMKFAKERQNQTRADREKALELFARRKLVLHHTRLTQFGESDYFRKRFRPLEARVLSDYLMELMVDSKVEVSEEELQKYYEEHSEEFRRPARIEAWHLAKKIRYPINASEKDRVTEEQRILGQLLEIRKKITTQGDSFLTWANRFTDYEDGGYLGWQPMMVLPPEWISVVASLEEGEISQPIRVRDTFELVLRGGIEEEGVLKFELARDKVQERTRAQKVAENRKQYLEALLADVQVTYDVQPAVDLFLRLLDRWKRPPQYWLDPYQ
jgi:parvulin-like peptidyl-prolyl isomerase